MRQTGEREEAGSMKLATRYWTMWCPIGYDASEAAAREGGAQLVLTADHLPHQPLVCVHGGV